MNFALWSIRNPTPALLLFALLTLLGIHGFMQFRIQDLPDIEAPQLEVMLSLPGAAPAQLETEVARKVEDAIVNVAGVKHIATSITNGMVMMTVELLMEKAVSDGLIEVKDAIDRIRSELPPDLEAPTVAAVRINAQALMTFAVSSTEWDEARLSWWVDDTLAKTLKKIGGVGKFVRLGGLTREIQVEVAPARLAALAVTAAELSQALKQAQLTSSGGRGFIGQAEQSMRTIATVNRAEELTALPIVLADGRQIRLDQVASVHDGHATRTQAVRYDGQASVGFQIFGAKGSNEVAIARACQQALAELSLRYPECKIVPVVNTVTYTWDQYQSSMRMLYEGALLAVAVVGLFLRDWRATLISAAALPLSIIPTFGIMYWLGYSLNTLSLLALAVVVGILIDDAIVEIENVDRHRRMGKTILEATQDAVNEIALAVIATTMAIVVVFLPTVLMSGVTGLFFKQFGWTVVISVLMSLLVARLITPLMAAKFLKHEGTPRQRSDSRLMRHYLRLVEGCLAHKGRTLCLATAFFGGTLLLATKLPTGLIPSSDQGYTNLGLELPPGSTLADSLATAEQIRQAVATVSGIAHTFTVVGAPQDDGEGATAGDVRRGTMTLIFSQQRPPQAVIDAEIRRILPRIPGAKFSLRNDGPGGSMSLLLASENTAALTTTVRELERELRGLGTLSNVQSTISLQRPEIDVHPDFARAAELGVTTDTIADTLRIATVGDFNPRLAKLNLENRQIPIRVRLPEQALQDIEAIAALRIPTRFGQTSLGTIAAITTQNGPAQVDRYDRQRYVSISADLGGAPLGQALDAALALPALKNKPSGIILIELGEAELMKELFSGFSYAILAGVVLVFCVLILLFKDFFQPLTILSALPLSFGGAIIALRLFGGELNLTALVGIVMLMGIVSKNSILLVEYAIVGIEERGLSVHEALLDACHKRARPIVMTTIAMIAGMAPIAVGVSGDSFRQPMAIAVIGGLISSTALSLMVVPVVFSYVHLAEVWVTRCTGTLSH